MPATVMTNQPLKKGLTSWEFWGRILLIPYALLFLIFVLYPVGYGLWLGQQPD